MIVLHNPARFYKPCRIYNPDLDVVNFQTAKIKSHQTIVFINLKPPIKTNFNLHKSCFLTQGQLNQRSISFVNSVRILLTSYLYSIKAIAKRLFQHIRN